MILQTPHKQRGMTLVELMIAMLLALVVAAAIITTFTNNSKSFKQDENILRLQDDARHALREIAFDVSMAGYYADLLLAGVVTPDTSLTLSTDCGPTASPDWMYQLSDVATGSNLSVTVVDNASTGAATGAHSCIAGAEFQPGTDIVSIKRVTGARTAVPSAGKVYLRTNGTVGLLFQEPPDSPPAITVPIPYSDWEYRPRIYFVRNYAEVAGDGLPTLCRKVLTGASPGMTTDCLAQGVENLQIEYGIDTDNDGNANVFMPSPTLAQLQGAVSARIFLLVRTVEDDQAYTNDKTYFVSNAAATTPGDKIHRRVFSTTVGIPNIRSLKLLGL